ncbi:MULTISPECIES: thiol-disulfide oxidoreductase ResA [Peribacillus]|uniref:thiol-disulfide oxidoreductase ResA n=1 Tax=Peribacillus TaxID=2675229 RepID=UPI000BA70AAF|nr:MULTISPECIES: thiol-disulfide oxidoreductase ResA [Peribacillus]MCM3169560.1 thiol-disulfide oxidoreductase ResA [Peribacillus frigoritolerans]MCT1389868.1 thiol-disulfide oxidoreductase ResA [Peribacillus frigoritolerans]PAL01816.1 thiol-disulfide oxidoreductase [Peribacillus simplex]QYF84895.1 thiol-disulfide oxidoreductase ResA [Brevibacterium sp. PAMC21349]
MKNKRTRSIVRISLLLLMALAVAYALYLNFFMEKTRVQAGDQAPDFVLENMEGNKVQLSELKGKGVFLNFWGTWCKPCEKEMPFMERQYNYFKNQGVEVLAVNIGESDVAIETFAKRYGLTFPILKDKKSVVTETYDITPIPTTFLIDKNGIVTKVITGSMTERDISNYMEEIKP